MGKKRQRLRDGARRELGPEKEEDTPVSDIPIGHFVRHSYDENGELKNPDAA